MTQIFDSAARLQTIASSGTNFFSVAPLYDYNSAGLLTHFTYGNGTEGFFSYNDRLQLETIRHHNSAGDLLNLAYSYTSTPDVHDNNGQIRSIKYYDAQGVEVQSRSVNYEYDALARLKKAYTTNLTSPNTWRLEWMYDRFGNRLTQTLTGGTASVYQPQLAVSETTNCITSLNFTCDPAGNLTADGLHNYTYDAENRLVKTATSGGADALYTHDGSGLRVTMTQGSNKITYIYSGTKVIEEFTGTTTKTLAREYIYAGGQLIATINGSAVQYRHNDHLSARVETDASGTPVRTYGHYPFGDTWYETGTASKWKFTTYEREDDTRPDYAMFRSYHPRWGRFMQADPLGSSADLLRPQTWDRYSYVADDPINRVDPLGLDDPPVFIEPPQDWWRDPNVPPGGYSYAGGIGHIGRPLPQGGAVSPPPGNGGGGGDAIEDRLRELYVYLVMNPDCLDFLTNRQSPTDSPLTYVSGMISSHAYNQAEIQPTRDSRGQVTSIVNAQTPGNAQGVATTVNTLGAFFDSTLEGHQLTTDRGRLTGGTVAAQWWIMLHEVAHGMGVLEHDGGTNGRGDQTIVDRNDRNLERHCNAGGTLLPRLHF